MASLGSLVVSLALDTAKWTSDLGKTGHQMARLVKDAEKMGAAIGANIVAGAVAFKALVIDAVDAADATSKLAESLGLSTQMLSEYTYAAELANVQQEELASGLAKLAKQAADAASKAEGSTSAFEQMGINIKNGQGGLKTTEQLLGEVADKFASYKNGAEKTALANEIFGKSGFKLIPFLNQGSKGLAELAEEARILGLSLTNEAGKSAEQFNDNLTRLKKAKEGLGIQIAQQLLPALERLTDDLFMSAKSTEGFSKAAAVAATGVKLLVSAAIIMANIFNQIGSVIGGIGAAVVALFQGEFKHAYEIASEIGKDFEARNKATNESLIAVWDDTANQVAAKADDNGTKLAAPIIKAAEKVKKQKSEIEKFIEQTEKKLKDMQLAVDTQGASDRIKGFLELVRGGATPEQIERYLKLSKAMEDYRDKVEKAAKAEQERRDVMQEGMQLTEELRTPLEKLTAEYDRLNFLLKENAINATTYARAVAKAQEEFSKAMEEGKKVNDQVTEFTKRMRENIQDAFGDTLFNLMQGKFENIGDAFVKMLQRMVAEAIAADLSSKLFGPSNQNGQGGMFGSVISTIGAALFGGRAYGGPVSAGRAVKINEHEQEVFIPSTSGSVQPVSKLGQTMNLAVNVTATPGMSQQTAMQQGLAIGQGIQRAMARNG